MSSYSPRRANWSQKVSKKFAIPIYQEIYPECKIESVEEYAKKSTSWRRRDFSGLDLICNTPEGNEIHLAQRFRSTDSGDDFSLRYMVPALNGGKQESEYFKLINAYKNGYYRPDQYAFGRTKFGIRVNVDNQTEGFSFFYIFKVDSILKAIIDGDLQKSGPFPNGDGSNAVYFRINQIPQEAILFERVWD